jgi:peptidoglycan/LPS O-acetylase OafA/YrhL
LIPVSIVLVGGDYAAQLAIDDASLDNTAPVFAAGLLVTAELSYWSLEERGRGCGEAGAGLRHAAFVAALGVATLLVASVLLVVVDSVRTKGLAIDLLGAVAAAAALFAIVFAARGQGRTDH